MLSILLFSAILAHAQLDPRCSDRTAKGQFTCTIDQPNVTQRETVLPNIVFAAGPDPSLSIPSSLKVGADGILTVHPRTPRKVQVIWTTQQFSNDFNLKLEFRAATNADSGIYIRGPQLQCRDYLVAGPYTNLVSYRPQDWNQIEIVVKGNAARCTCNGELLEEAFAVPETGPIGLEGDRSQMEYRRIQIKMP